jgi:hypothetical protein
MRLYDQKGLLTSFCASIPDTNLYDLIKDLDTMLEVSEHATDDGVERLKLQSLIQSILRLSGSMSQALEVVKRINTENNGRILNISSDFQTTYPPSRFAPCLPALFASKQLPTASSSTNFALPSDTQKRSVGWRRHHHRAHYRGRPHRPARAQQHQGQAEAMRHQGTWIANSVIRATNTNAISNG